MEDNGNNKVGKYELSRRISNKYKGLTGKATSDFIDILVEEILELVFKEKREVLIPRICNIRLTKCRKYGYDFKTKTRILGEEQFKISIKPHNAMRENLELLNSNDREV